MWKYKLVLEKNCITKREYFRIFNKVDLVMGITDAKLLLCNGI